MALTITNVSSAIYILSVPATTFLDVGIWSILGATSQNTSYSWAHIMVLWQGCFKSSKKSKAGKPS